MTEEWVCAPRKYGRVMQEGRRIVQQHYEPMARWALYRTIGRNPSPIRGATRYQTMDFARESGRELVPKRKSL